MKVDALKLLDGPIVVELDEGVDVLGVEDDPVYEFLEGLSGRLVFTRMLDSQVLLRGILSTRVRAHCVRCLEPVELPLESDVTLLYAHDPDLLDESRRADLPEDLLYFDGHIIDPMEDLRELLLLELPSYPTCDLVAGHACDPETVKYAGADAESLDKPATPGEEETSPPVEVAEPEWKLALRNASALRKLKTP